MAEGQDQFQLLVESVRDYAIFLLDVNGYVMSWNEGAEHIKGYQAHQIIGQHFSTFYTTEDKQRGLPARALEIAAAEGRYEQEGWRVRRNGSRFWSNVVITALRDPQGKLVGFGKVTRDLTERKLAEDELKISRNDLMDLSRRLQAAREEERTRLARELHDELGQRLTTLKMGAVWLKKHLATDSDPAQSLAKTQEMLATIDSTFRVIRHISAELRPAILDAFGLPEAIDWMVQDVQGKSELEVNYTAALDGVWLDGETTTAVFRIVQEAMTNVLRHARANRLDISISAENKTLICRVHDDGRGITPQDISNGSFGLTGMRERAHLVGGELSIDGSPGKGTTVLLTVPLH